MLKKAHLIVPLSYLVIGVIAVAGGLPAAAAITAAGPSTDGTVKTESGMISGLVVGANKDISVYKGIPYAAPPVRDLRLQAPQPAKPWTGVRECTHSRTPVQGLAGCG